jgi:DNA helicase-2/ATP-dependent DNA helicase PcrA
VELASRNIPFVKYGGLKFVEAAHIKDILSYLRIAYNNHDEVSWLRALLLLPGIGPKTAERIIGAIVGKDKEPDVKLLRKTEDLVRLFELLKESNAKESRPAELIEKFLKYYQPLLKEKYDDFHKRINDLDSLLGIAGRYDSLESFLADMALEPPERSLVEAGKKDRDDSSLTLSTIHSAKGLEWHTVFLIYVAEGHLPSYLSLENEDDIEEERRLFYVAATRAKENLFLLKPHLDRSPRAFMDGGGRVFTQVSRFLDQGNILRELVETESFGERDEFSDIDVDDMIGRRQVFDKEFFGKMRDYFED